MTHRLVHTGKSLLVLTAATLGMLAASTDWRPGAIAAPAAANLDATAAVALRTDPPAGSCVPGSGPRELLLAQANTKKTAARKAPSATMGKPNIVVIFGDDIGQTNVSAYSMGLMGYRTPSIDRIAREGMIFTDYYAEQSCTAGRSSFLTGQCTLRTGLSKVGVPAAPVGLQKEDATIAELLKNQGYVSGQFGKNHLGDKNEFLPTVHGFDEFFGNLYHLNAEEEPEQPHLPARPQIP